MFKQESRNEIFEIILANAGGTFSFSGEPVSFPDGYAVSVAGFETVTQLEGMSARNFVNLANDLVKKVDGLADPSTHFIGAWIEDGNLYIDLSVRVEDKDSALVKAKNADQLAIWDFALEESVYLDRP